MEKFRRFESDCTSMDGLVSLSHIHTQTVGFILILSKSKIVYPLGVGVVSDNTLIQMSICRLVSPTKSISHYIDLYYYFLYFPFVFLLFVVFPCFFSIFLYLLFCQVSSLISFPRSLLTQSSVYQFLFLNCFHFLFVFVQLFFPFLFFFSFD